MVRDASEMSFDKDCLTVRNGLQHFAKLARPDDAELVRDKAIDVREAP
jgi:hypothetical protein